jgi:hypothetical protein
MFNIPSFLASTYAVYTPLMNTAGLMCTVNNESVPCPEWMFSFLVGFSLVFFLIFIVMVCSFWIIYTKAHKPGWTSLVPIYNTIVMLEIIGRPTWWVILSFIPVVNIFVGFIMLYELGKSFGKGGGFMLGLIFLPVVFYPLLAFGRSEYIHPMVREQQPQL